MSMIPILWRTTVNFGYKAGPIIYKGAIYTAQGISLFYKSLRAGRSLKNLIEIFGSKTMKNSEKSARMGAEMTYATLEVANISARASKIFGANIPPIVVSNLNTAAGAGDIINTAVKNFYDENGYHETILTALWRLTDICSEFAMCQDINDTKSKIAAELSAIFGVSYNVFEKRKLIHKHILKCLYDPLMKKFFKEQNWNLHSLEKNIGLLSMSEKENIEILIEILQDETKESEIYSDPQNWGITENKIPRAVFHNSKYIKCRISNLPIINKIVSPYKNGKPMKDNKGEFIYYEEENLKNIRQDSIPNGCSEMPDSYELCEEKQKTLDNIKKADIEQFGGNISVAKKHLEKLKSQSKSISSSSLSFQEDEKDNA